MLFFVLFLIILNCGVFCYLFYKILEIEKDLEILYNNYSKELEKNIKIRVEEYKRC